MGHKKTYELIGETIFPVEYHENGLIFIDYPDYNPLVAKKITEEGRKNLEEMGLKISKLMKEKNITIKLGNHGT